MMYITNKEVQNIEKVLSAFSDPKVILLAYQRDYIDLQQAIKNIIELVDGNMSVQEICDMLEIKTVQGRYKVQNHIRTIKSGKYWENPNVAKSLEYKLAHQKVSMAIRSGLLKKQPCEICHEINSVAHHPDYNKPLEVRWLCLKHHRLEHKKIKGSL